MGCEYILHLIRLTMVKIITDSLALAKQRYGAGMWEPGIVTKRNKNGQLVMSHLDYDNQKFWPYKKWSLIDGEWIPSLEMPANPKKSDNG